MRNHSPELSSSAHDYRSSYARSELAQALNRQLNDYDLSNRVRRALVRHVQKPNNRFSTLDELRGLSEKDFLKISGFGPKTWKEFSSKVPPQS